MLCFPNENLIEPCASSSGSPSDNKTCEGSNEPDEHAEPDETAIPARSRLKSIDSPSINLKEKSAFAGNLFSLGPLSLTKGTSARTLSINLSLKEELENTKEELIFFKDENLQLYKDYTKHCQLYHQDSMINPIDMRLVFIDGDICYYDRYHNNALYYMDENGILIPLYNEDGSIKIFEYPK